MIDRERRIHFVGIGGVGMSALAEVLLARGTRVSGSDLRASPATSRLAARGATVHIGHQAHHVAEADVVVASRAISETNVEVVAARARGVPVQHRAQVLGQVLAEGFGLAVVGTHGKTTTAAMIAHTLTAGGYDPTALIGADLEAFHGNVRIGQGRYVVAEVDESDGSLLYVRPTAAVVTSLDITDHRDYYRTVGRLVDTFATFVATVPSAGFVVVCTDHPHVRGLMPQIQANVITYGLVVGAEYSAVLHRLAGATTQATFLRHQQPLGPVTLCIPGRYNVANALAAAAVTLELGMPFARIADALAEFRGLSRRFSVRGEVDGIMVVDDYAHNPIKVAVVLQAARECWPDRRVVAIFQPHRYSRTKTTYKRFADAFGDADELIITEIYPADEAVMPGVSARLIVDVVRAHQPVVFIESKDRVIEYVLPRLRAGDLVLTLGAGDIWQVADDLVRALRAGGAGESGTSERSAPRAGGPSG